MREILFRAWVLGKMYDVKALDFNKHGVTIITSGGFHTIEEGTRDEVSHLMQFTGLLDENGVKIFEGDIVSDGDDNYTVVYDEDDALFEMVNGNVSDTFRDYMSEMFEVIGNIHEKEEMK